MTNWHLSKYRPSADATDLSLLAATLGVAGIFGIIALTFDIRFGSRPK
jgi:hypothetical protein